MIKVGILGAEKADSGELIRILAMHPDVELKAAQARGLEGQALTSVHHGLIGETDLSFTGSVDYSKIDVLFVVGEGPGEAELKQLRLCRPDLKVILLGNCNLDYERDNVVYGFPELNRKLLVRGANCAVVPGTFASMALVALLPFAENLLLRGDIDIEISGPQALIEDTDLEATEREIAETLHGVQLSFEGKVNIKATPAKSRRSALMHIGFDGIVDRPQILDLFSRYNDHRFAFVTTSQVGVSEVAGTNKCVVSVDKITDGRVNLTAAADCRLRGGAGEAVHIMNLMCGLHEKTGLHLKAIDYTKI